MSLVRFETQLPSQIADDFEVETAETRYLSQCKYNRATMASITKGDVPPILTSGKNSRPGCGVLLTH